MMSNETDRTERPSVLLISVDALKPEFVFRQEAHGVRLLNISRYFLENGMEADLDIAFTQREEEGMTLYDPRVDYRGDNADCTAFMNGYMDWSLMENPWTWERLDTLPFAAYRELFTNNIP